MRWFTYDFEVSSHDWLLVMKDKSTGEYTVVHNDNETVQAIVNTEDIYCGFNSKHYDQFIMKGVCCGFTPADIKKLNDYLIADGRGWDYEPLKPYYFTFNNVDIRDDTQIGLSLKAIEAHLGLSIQETTVAFDLDRPWTEQELKEMVFYCKHDVDATEHLTDVRREYLVTKKNLGTMVGIPMEKALSMTNAKLTAAFLHAERPQKDRGDERKYQLPANLKLEYIPQEVLDFFARMYDSKLTDEEIFKSQIEIPVGEANAVIGFGGIHLGIPNYVWKEEKCESG